MKHLQCAGLVFALATACGGRTTPLSSNADAGENGDNDGGVDGARRTLPAPASHRPEGASCAPSVVGSEPFVPPSGGPDASAVTCTTNEECTAHAGGRCIYTGGACSVPCTPTPPGTTCVYDTCSVDSDCPKNAVCLCGGGGATNACGEAGNCRVDADCASGFCSRLVDPCGQPRGYFCHTSLDECRDQTDCKTLGGACVVDTDSVWKCLPIGCAGGAAQ